jgi:demethylmenaquinone methyltransferase/2-methoxy-6-polyprenyl-1,4-benzoquinol methylase
MNNHSSYENVNPYDNSRLSKKNQIIKVFDTISDVYDKVNKILFFGLHSVWRKKVVKILIDKKPVKILDIATGTGDLAIDLTKTNAKNIVGVDISKEMLKIARNKVNNNNLNDIIEIQLGDAENLNFQDNYFDAITCSFGVRNFEDLPKALQEINRTLKPNGTFVILETSNPENFPFKQIHHLYIKYIVPFVGRMFSKDKYAYKYLSKSLTKFPSGIHFNNILNKIGFINIENRPQTFGATTIYVANKK